MKVFKLSEIWVEKRPEQHADYSGHGLDPLPPYQYKPIQSDQIRLLHLLPGSGRDRIRFELKTAALHQLPDFEAVSYCWGEVHPSCSIISDNGTGLPVTRNGVDALWHFRLPDQTRVLWMDAVCINQQDLQERAQQVTIMDEIYGGATQTLAWAGNAGLHDGAVFTLLKNFQSAVQKNIISQVKSMDIYQHNTRIKAAVDGADDWVAWHFLYHCLQNTWEGDR